MKFLHYFFSSFFLMVLVSCSSSYNDILPPPVSQDVNLINTVQISNTTMKLMEGIYKLSDGKADLGKQFVCKVSKYKISFFSDANGIFIILKYGLNPSDNSIRFSGFWRYSENSRQGLISFTISNNGGASKLLQDGIVTNLMLVGVFGEGNGTPRGIALQYVRPFSQYTKDNEFMVFAHHGIQTTSNPPYAENSLKAALYAQDYGVNGIEYDIRLTKDNVPICIHDEAINTRLTQKSPLSGNYNQYSYAFLRDFIDLIDGQQIPSVEQMLEVVVDSTSLKYVWLDIKGDPGIFKYLKPLVQKAYAHAASKKREFTIIAGLPSKDVIAEFQATKNYNYPTICELSVQDAINNNSLFYGPRYSEGLLLEDVDRAHSLGIKVVSWTLNDKNIILNYLQNGRFDGFISDYPAYVVYDFYTIF